MTLLAEAPADVRPPASSRRRWVAVIIVAAVVLAALEGFWYWRTNLQYFGTGGNEIGAPLTVGQTLFADAALEPRPARVDLRSVRPRVSRNTAQATVRVVVCRGLRIGTALPDFVAHASCSPFRPGVVDLGDGRSQLVYAITAKRPGVVRIEGADVRYADGFRTGAERSGIDVVVRVR